MKHARKMTARLGLFCLLVALPGCVFSRKPPLPKHASIEQVARPATYFAPMVAKADIIYFPGNRAASGGRAEPAALLLEALEQTGTALAVGWDLIDASQQPLLDQIQATPNGREREALIAHLDIVGSGRAREHCRAVLRDAPPGMRQLALRSPASLIVKLATLEAPTPEEETLLPRGYRAPAGGLDAYAEQHGSPSSDLTESYRAQMFNQQFVAERIVRYFREAGNGSKLLAFVAPADLEDGRGVPTYVAQKLSLRQLVLGSDLPNESRTKLVSR